MPLTDPALTTTPGPDAVPVVAAPTAAPAAEEVSSPEGVAVAWLARWCSYNWRTPLGTREEAALPLMTERGSLDFDPLTAPAKAQEWSAIVAAQETAGCSTPTAVINPEAPRSDTGAYVIVTANRVVTGPTGARRVQMVQETRQVLLRDGAWRVDIVVAAG